MADSSPWLTIKAAAAYASTGTKLLRHAIASGHLKAARVGGRREVRVRKEWIDEFFEQCARK